MQTQSNIEKLTPLLPRAQEHRKALCLYSRHNSASHQVPNIEVSGRQARVGPLNTNISNQVSEWLTLTSEENNILMSELAGMPPDRITKSTEA